ncbi:hypothetical protein G7046_g2890 [Stylonectria norvegica]|nr:hypothetical protein G7046_g2890 [Stylonectria norvegica]
MSVDSPAAPPFYPLADDQHGALVVVAAIIFLIYAVLGIVAKSLIRLQIASMKLHDVMLLVAGLLYFIQTICVIVACNNGLGQHQSELSSVNFARYSKLIYASRILALCVNGCTKISLCLLIRQINGAGRLNLANLVLGGVTLAWVASGFFALAFECPLPSPWLAVSEKQCPSRGPVYIYNGILNILTDLALCILPVAMMWHVQTTIRRKMVVMALFGTRIIVPIVTIPSLSNAQYLFHEYSDATWLSVPSTIWFQISLGLSILTACIPSLKGIIDSLLGSTAVAAIRSPYDLRDSGKKSGLEMTALGGSGSHNPSHNLSGTGGIKLSSKMKSANNTTWSADREIHAKYGGKGSPASGSGSGSESVRKLTEGVIIVRDEFELHYDEGRGSQSRGSRGSSDGDYRASYN